MFDPPGSRRRTLYQKSIDRKRNKVERDLAVLQGPVDNNPRAWRPDRLQDLLQNICDLYLMGATDPQAVAHFIEEHVHHLFTEGVNAAAVPRDLYLPIAATSTDLTAVQARPKAAAKQADVFDLIHGANTSLRPSVERPVWFRGDHFYYTNVADDGTKEKPVDLIEQPREQPRPRIEQPRPRIFSSILQFFGP